jgi:hypothetical protein
MKVTFDTNALDKAVRPERYPRDPLQSDYFKVRDALRTGRLKGYFSQTLIALEGIENKDRVNVLGSTRLESQTQSTNKDTIPISLTVQQDRNPIHHENSQRIQAAQEIGMRALRGPARLGDGFSVKDDDGSFYEPDESLQELIQRREKANEVDVAIAARGVGRAIAQSLGLKFSARDGVSEWWLQGLKRARDIHERGEVNRAIAEWADAESIASHIGYEIDFFCTNDLGRSAGTASIFAPDNRAWLTSTYGVAFVTLPELIQKVGA